MAAITSYTSSSGAIVVAMVQRLSPGITVTVCVAGAAVSAETAAGDSSTPSRKATVRVAAAAAAITGIPRSSSRPRRVRWMAAGRRRAAAGEPANCAVMSVMVSSSEGLRPVA